MDWLQLSLIAVSGLLFLLFNELEDECVRNNWENNRQFFNTNKSWQNKWQMPLVKPTKHWYYFGITPKYKERFYLSSTILVFLTDGEHLTQFFKKRFIEIGFLLIGWEVAVAWAVGTMLMQVIKEKFIKFIN